MTVCDSWVYYGIDESKWEQIKQYCHDKYNINIHGREGHMEVTGVTVQYKYHPDSQLGEMTVLSKPLFLPCRVIKKLIDDVFYQI